LEVQRTEKVIGASLEAAPVLYLADQAVKDVLEQMPFADICITSDLTLSIDAAPSDAFTMAEVEGVAVSFVKAEGEKCGRCWKILPDVGTHNHAGVCGRCDEALS
jgi:isoleucyl-tRNA synthetase